MKVQTPNESGNVTGAPPAASRFRYARALAPLGIVFLATGSAKALAGPFLTLFLITAAHAGPLPVSVFLIAQPLCGVAASSMMGRLSDRRFERRHVLLVAAVGGALGAASFALVRDYWLLLLLGCTVNALAGAVMPQGFAYARMVLTGDPDAPMLTSTLRMFFSLAWVAGPPLAAALLANGGFAFVYGAAAILYVVVAAVAAFWLGNAGGTGRNAPRHSNSENRPDAPRRNLWLTLIGLVVIQSSMTVNVQALPLHIAQNLHGGVDAAGQVLGLCAGLEIPAMLAFGYLSKRFSLRGLIRLGPPLGAAYYLLAAISTQVWQLAAAQVLNACFIAIVGGLAISYVQELLPSQPGRATTLYSNTFPCGAILAGPLMGLAIGHSYRLPYISAAGLSLVGLALIVAGSGPRLVNRREVTVVGLPLGALEGG